MRTKGKKGYIVGSSIFLMAIMLGSMGLEIASSNIIPEIDSIIVSKSVADVGEEIQFNVSLSLLSGVASYYVFEFRDGSQPLATTSQSVTHAFPMEVLSGTYPLLLILSTRMYHSWKEIPTYSMQTPLIQPMIFTD